MNRIYLLMLLTLASQGRGAQLAKGSGSLNQVSYRYATHLEPAEPGVKRLTTGTINDGKTVQRHLCIDDRKTYFGYDLRFEPVGDGRVRVLFSPSSITPDKMARIMKSDGWTMLAVPAMPGPQVVSPGDEVVFDLFVHPQTGQRIVEHVWVEAPLGLPSPVFKNVAEMKISDVWMTLGRLKVGLNNQETNVGGSATVMGHEVWFAVPQRGRYFLTLSPRVGYERAGEVTARTLLFRAGLETIAAASEQRIIPAEGSFALFVRHEPAYRGEAVLGAQ
jgi:hypothetical protein